jgi:hypothetical protein
MGSTCILGEYDMWTNLVHVHIFRHLITVQICCGYRFFGWLSLFCGLIFFYFLFIYLVLVFFILLPKIGYDNSQCNWTATVNHMVVKWLTTMLISSRKQSLAKASRQKLTENVDM